MRDLGGLDLTGKGESNAHKMRKTPIFADYPLLAGDQP
jgi:hypothetical protein